MRQLTKLIIAIAFPLVLIAYPLSILLPVEPQEIENRALEPPEIRLEDLTSITTYQETLAYVRSANPLRAMLIRVAAGLDFTVLGDSPDPSRVLKGKNEWVYYRPTMETPCSGSPRRVVANVRDFLARLEKQVPTVVFTIAPSKFVIHPEHLTDDQIRLSACAREAGALLRTLVAESPPTHYVDSWELFERLKSSGMQPYFRTDTHFNFEASIPWMEAIVGELDDIWDPNAVRHLGSTLWLGNLMSFISLEQPELVEHFVVQRDVSGSGTQIRPRITNYRHVGDTNLVGGNSLIIGDSFMELPEQSLVQYFADVTVVDWRAEASVDYFLSQVARSSVIIIEVSELDIWRFFGDRSILDAYEETLPAAAAANPSVGYDHVEWGHTGRGDW